MPRAISLIAALALLILAAACGNTDTPVPTATATVPAFPTSTPTPGSLSKPPLATMIVDGNEQIAGLGTYTWRE